MAVASRSRAQVLTLNHSEQKALRLFAFLVLLGVTAFGALGTVLQVPFLAPFPGLNRDFVMLSISILVPFGLLATFFKAIEARLMGKYIERVLKIEDKLGHPRDTRLRAVFHKDIRQSAFWGGTLNAVFQVLTVIMIPLISPAAIASARSLVILFLGILEIVVGLLPRRFALVLRLVLSVAITLVGVFSITVANALALALHGKPLTLAAFWAVMTAPDRLAALFTGSNSFAMGLFLLLVIPGNICLALAEYAEYKGVHTTSVGCAVYTYARFICFTLSCTVAMIVWGLAHHELGQFVVVLEMTASRWYFLLPISIVVGFADLLRISLKPVVSATFMYIFGSLGVVLTALIQTWAYSLAPHLFRVVPGGQTFMFIGIAGGLVIAVGTLLCPHISPPKKSVTAVPAESSE